VRPGGSRLITMRVRRMTTGEIWWHRCDMMTVRSGRCEGGGVMTWSRLPSSGVVGVARMRR
jgi:hypothetical protein